MLLLLKRVVLLVQEADSLSDALRGEEVKTMRVMDGDDRCLPAKMSWPSAGERPSLPL